MKKYALIPLLLITILTGCGEKPRNISSSELNKLQTGMTPTEVQELLGKLYRK